jgi:hypothetical protein
VSNEGRSSSRSRSHCPTEASPLAFSGLPFGGHDHTVGVALNARDSNYVSLDSSSFRGVILSEHDVEPILADKVDVVRFAG